MNSFPLRIEDDKFNCPPNFSSTSGNVPSYQSYHLPGRLIFFLFVQVISSEIAPDANENSLIKVVLNQASFY